MRKFFVGVMLILSLFGSVSLPGGTEGQPSSEPLDKKAIVQVVSFFFDGEGNYLTHKTGSGSIIREDGLILTNSHVIRSTSGGCGRPILETDPIADFIAVLVLEEEGLPPVPRYVATAEKEDRALDVATLKIEESIKLDISQEGGQKANLNDLVEAVKEKRYQLEAVPPLELPKLGLGDSNSIRPGGFVKTYGYPALEELPRFTVTRGNISQVQEDFILVEHAFAARGSSGGAIIEEANQLLVGVLCGGGPEPSVYTGELLARARPLNSIITILPEDVYQHPLAAFTFSPEHPLLGQSVQFDASASRSIGATITKYE